MQDDEYCLYINGTETADLWAILSDWTKSEDEEEWNKHVLRFSRLISCWQPLGFIKVFRSDECPADPASWEYQEEPTRWICVAPGDRSIEEAK
ncbi:hypothetical protein [Streptomyces endophyticus]|uniref:Uncharacterized protein n=1 Tax=Streptomyces endophyticus TaxID=714166 RepID=A0ABU6F821_9ACTN|nr:hypothetical protein [Streptomyces endophyticus]MEB8340166.1 hypothetical protein [Streptomyces endophyticus]